MLQMFLLFFQDAGEGAGGLMSFLPFILIMVIIYFLMMRPQLKKQKEKQKMVEELKKGDNVITRGGIHGKVVGFTDENKTAIVKVDDNVKLNLDKGAIELVLPVGGKTGAGDVKK
ncbi:MAG: preprotein translocase subunit YajC [Calditrichaeota bacterium]|nr:MAG: preprotein translocase subunit YajC [Calditrichota bacterium]MBL1204250.1 preprotein translocase subunit YajC [Calditrichota bacterium]NOG44080.1 preprotein translocase subunit YajC [Calditrichota bacterium]